MQIDGSSESNKLSGTPLLTKAQRIAKLFSCSPMIVGHTVGKQATGRPLKLQRILRGDEEFTCAYASASQYNQRISNSACGLASLKFVRHVIALSTSGKRGGEILEILLERETMEVRASMSIMFKVVR